MDKWVFDAFTQLFRRCGPGTPNQKKMLCGCTPMNPAHHVRISGNVEPALKAKGQADGTPFMRGVSASKIHDIIARFGVESKAAAINPDQAERHGLVHKTYTAKSVVFGWVPIHQGSGAAGVAATPAAPSVPVRLRFGMSGTRGSLRCLRGGGVGATVRAGVLLGGWWATCLWPVRPVSPSSFSSTWPLRLGRPFGVAGGKGVGRGR